MKNKIVAILLCCLMTILFIISCTLPNNYQQTNELVLERQVILDDMELLNDGHPADVPPSYSWYHKGYSWWEPHMFTWAKGPFPPEGFTQIIAWGQVYADETMPDVDIEYPNVRVHLRDMELWILQENDIWIQIGGGEKIDGGAYVADFVGDISKPADIHKENDGGISVQAGSGFNFHFWPYNGQYDIEPYNIKGVLVVCKARLIGVVGNQNPKYLVSIGADYWKPNAQWGGLNQNNIAVGAGRHKYVTKQWQYFTMHTFTPEEVLNVIFPVIR